MHDAEDELDDDSDEKIEEMFERKKDHAQDKKVCFIILLSGVHVLLFKVLKIIHLLSIET